MAARRPVLAAALAAAFAGVVHTPKAADAEDAEPPPLTSEVWTEPRPPLDLHWEILALPERVVELAFSPLALLVTTAQRYRLDERIPDWLENEAGTVRVTPKIKVSVGDGFGLGLKLSLKELLRDTARFDFSGLVVLDGDREAYVRYRDEYPRLEGRRFDVKVEYEVDSNDPYFGLGNDTTPEDERVIRTDIVEARALLDLTGRGILNVRGQVGIGYRHEEILPGVSSSVLPAGEPGDSVPPPPGFEQANDYPRLGFALRYDSRDTVGLPRRGVLADLSTSLTSDVNGNGLSALRGDLAFATFFGILPRHRTIGVSAGFSGVTPLSAGDEVPLSELVTLGRDEHMRGFSRDRFRGRAGWWTTLEYQWAVYEYKNTGVRLQGIAFVDVGRIGDDPADVFKGAPRVSYGFGARLAHETTRVASFHVGFSEEGVEFAFGAGL